MPFEAYVALAKKAVAHSVKTGSVLPENEYRDEVPGEMFEKRAGAFVSIHEGGELRGCIGTFLPCYSCIAEEIARNALEASLHDPRFSAITEDELPALEISVDILSEPEPVTSVEELDAKKYGVIVTDGARRGLLLPDLDGVDSVQEQLYIAKRKAGIAPDKEVSVMRFTVERHSE